MKAPLPWLLSRAAAGAGGARAWSYGAVATQEQMARPFRLPHPAVAPLPPLCAPLQAQVERAWSHRKSVTQEQMEAIHDYLGEEDARDLGFERTRQVADALHMPYESVRPAPPPPTRGHPSTPPHPTPPRPTHPTPPYPKEVLLRWLAPCAMQPLPALGPSVVFS